MPHGLLKHEEIFNKTIYHTHEPITTTFSAFEKLLKFYDITRTLYTQHQAVNIDYMIIHRTGKFDLSICKWNRMLTIQKPWVDLKQFFQKAHHKLRKTTDLTVKDAGMHH